MKKLLFTVSVAALFLATGTAHASWGDVWQCGKIKVTREWSPAETFEPQITFDGKIKRFRFKLLSHGRAKLNGKLCKRLIDESWI
jgi:hypothetical protein